MNGSGAGKRVKIVRKRLADGSVKEYRYDLDAIARRLYVEERKSAIHRIALDYCRSPEFLSLSPRWQNAVRVYVSIIEAELGWMTIDDLNGRESRGDFFDLRDKFAAYPAKADKLMNVLRSLLNFAYDRGRIAANHALRIPKLVPSSHNRAEHIWTPDLRQQFFSKAKPCLQRLMLFALYTGARQSDICPLRWSHLQDGWLVYQPSKTRHTTGIRVFLPVYALTPLDALLKGIQRPSGDGPILLTDDRPRAWTPENIKRQMRLCRAAAGMEDVDLTFHDLRGTAQTEMLEAGATEAEVNAVLGHVLLSGKGARNYAARSKKLALNAYNRWNAALAGEAKVINLAGLETTVS